MENSIEAIWKQGFLNESSLVAPQINDLYNQKSIHVVDRIKRKMKFNRKFVLIAAFFFLVFYCFMGALWQGVVICLLFLFRILYVKSVMDSNQLPDQGATSYDYLKSFDKWLKEILSKIEKVARYSNTVIVPLAMSAAWSIWSKHGIIVKLSQRFPNLDIPLIGIIILIAFTLPMFYFSARINKWDVRIVYGRLLDKLEDTIAEMEKLKQGE